MLFRVSIELDWISVEVKPFLDSLVLLSDKYFWDYKLLLARLSVKEKGSLLGGRYRGGWGFSIVAGIASIY